MNYMHYIYNIYVRLFQWSHDHLQVIVVSCCVFFQVAAKGGGSDAATNKRKALEAAQKLRDPKNWNIKWRSKVRLQDAEKTMHIFIYLHMCIYIYIYTIQLYIGFEF